LAKRELINSTVKIVAVVGFPLGASATTIKVLETKTCINDGADEIDMVINVGMLKSKDFKYLENEIQAVKNEVGDRILKVIIETCYLTNEEKKVVCEIAMNAGADFVKTSTGFGTNGATIADVKLIKEVLKGQLSIKASGGIRDKETALNYISMGVSRIGTSSGIKIVT
jgi:deoxyribose-phosphate aldolase